MIPYIDKRLQDWAKWHYTGSASFGGNILQRLIDSGGVLIGSTAQYDPKCFLEELLTEKAVASLPDELKYAVQVAYLDGGPITLKLSKCRCSKATYFRRLDHAHLRVMDYLNMHDEVEERKNSLTMRETVL